MMTSRTLRRIIYLTLPKLAPSFRFRVHQYLNEIEKHGFRVTVKEIPKGTIQRIRLANTLTEYDVVVLQKRLFQPWFVWFLRNKAKTLVYDFDDAVMYRSSMHGSKHSANRKRRFRSIVSKADIVVAGNNYLKSMADAYARQTVVIPTGIDIDSYLPHRQQSQTITIGWIGSKTNLNYLKDLIEPLNKLYMSFPNFRLKVVCDGFVEGFKCPVVKKVWCEEDEVSDIQSFDIGVLPLKDDYWTKGKCALKLLQYMSCGLASVSSNLMFISSIIKHGHNGLLSNSIEQWYENLIVLLRKPQLRERMGNYARLSVEGKFDIKTISRKYVEVFDMAIRK